MLQENEETNTDTNTILKSSKSDRTKVLNKAPATKQITAEQLLREAYEHKTEDIKPPVSKITDPEELASYQLQKRTEFENVIRRQRLSIGIWMKYAAWEETQQEWERVRSIFERAINVDYRNRTIWTKYAEFEMKNRFVNHARNVWDRAVQLLPRIDQFWYKYALMEEKLGNFEGARAIFERWMKWHPPENAFESYIKLEMRCSGKREQKLSRARQIWRKLTLSHGNLDSYLKWAKFEEKHGNITNAREVYMIALNELEETAQDVKLFIAFASLEQKAKEIERARTIYKYALDHIPKHLSDELYQRYISFEKQNGERNAIDYVIINKKRSKLEEEIKKNNLNYDIWFDYIKLEEENGDVRIIREIYERAIAQVPLIQEKRYWKRYIYFWIYYAIFEETVTKDFERARTIYKECLSIIPLHKFNFGKIWLMRAHFEIRRNDISRARQILGESIGKCPKANIFNGYAEIEAKLMQLDRCRIIYEKFLQFAPENCDAWQKYALMEAAAGENIRARSIFELGINQDILDMPETLWTKFIDFESSLKEYDNVKKLYERLLDRTKNVKVWISYAQSFLEFGKADISREVYKRGDAYFRSEGQNSNALRNELLHNWLKMEIKLGNKDEIYRLKKKLPKEIKRKKLIKDENGMDAGYHEYIDYIFPDAETLHGSNLKLLAMAHKWKKQKNVNE